MQAFSFKDSGRSAAYIAAARRELRHGATVMEAHRSGLVADARAAANRYSFKDSGRSDVYIRAAKAALASGHSVYHAHRLGLLADAERAAMTGDEKDRVKFEQMQAAMFGEENVAGWFMPVNHNGTPLMNKPTRSVVRAARECAKYSAATGNGASVRRCGANGR